MQNSSIVLFKDFLHKTNPKKNGQTSQNHQKTTSLHSKTGTLHKIQMKHMIKQIQKNKIPLKDTLYHPIPKRNISDKHHSDPFIHKSMRVTSRQNYKPTTASNSQRKTKKESTAENQNSFREHHKTMPLVNMEQQPPIRVMPKEQSPPHRINTTLSGRTHKEIPPLKINLSLLKGKQNNKKYRSEKKHIRSTSQRFHKKQKQPKSNLLDPRQLEIVLNPRRHQTRIKIQQQIQEHLRHHSYTQRVVDMFMTEQPQKNTTNYSERLEQLNSSKIIFHRKNDPRKQFLINVRKLNYEQNRWKGSETERNHTYQDVHQDRSPEIYHQTTRKKPKIPISKNEPKRFNTFNPKPKKIEDVDDYTIQPW